MNECGCCGDEKWITPGDPYPEELPDFTLHQLNSAAHRIARACLRERHVLFNFASDGEKLQDLLDETYRELDAATDEYERLVSENE